MIRPLEPSPLDEEPLLRPLVVGSDKEEAGDAANRVRQRPAAASSSGATTGHHYYSTRARSVVLQVHDQIIRVSDEEEDGGANDDDDDNDDGRRLKATAFVFGACGLRSFGHSTFWRFVGGLLKCIWAYYFFLWAIIYGGLALCFLVSIVYEGWSTAEPLGMAAIVVSMLPVLNLLWINFSFVFHVLFLGTLWDYYDLGKYAKPYIHTHTYIHTYIRIPLFPTTPPLGSFRPIIPYPHPAESSLHAIRLRLRSLSAKTFLTVLITFLVNGPVLFSLLVFCVATAKPVSDG